MFRKILYATALEAYYREVFGCITNLRRAGTEEIVLVHVIRAEERFPVKGRQARQMLASLAAELSGRMEEAVRIAQAQGLKAKVRVETGLPWRRILQAADEEQVSLIVSGRERKSGLDEILFGSTTDRLVRYGRLPVYIPKCPEVYGGGVSSENAPCRDPFRRVLFPVDWSECSQAALEALRRLKASAVGEIVVVHVMDEKAMSLQPDEKFREFERLDRRKLEDTERRLRSEGFAVRTRLAVGNPRAALLPIAREEDVSLVFMGTHGKGRVEGILWGSVSRNVAEYSDRPVLLVRGGSCAASAPGAA